MRELVTILTRPYPLIESFVANRAKAGFFAPNTNQFRAPFIELKPLNGHLFHAIIEFKGFGFEGIAFSRLGLGISGAVMIRSEASWSRIDLKFQTIGRLGVPKIV